MIRIIGIFVLYVFIFSNLGAYPTWRGVVQNEQDGQIIECIEDVAVNEREFSESEQLLLDNIVKRDKHPNNVVIWHESTNSCVNRALARMHNEDLVFFLNEGAQYLRLQQLSQTTLIFRDMMGFPLRALGLSLGMTPKYLEICDYAVRDIMNAPSSKEEWKKYGDITVFDIKLSMQMKLDSVNAAIHKDSSNKMQKLYNLWCEHKSRAVKELDAFNFNDRENLYMQLVTYAKARSKGEIEVAEENLLELETEHRNLLCLTEIIRKKDNHVLLYDAGVTVGYIFKHLTSTFGFKVKKQSSENIPGETVKAYANCCRKYLTVGEVLQMLTVSSVSEKMKIMKKELPKEEWQD